MLSANLSRCGALAGVVLGKDRTLHCDWRLHLNLHSHTVRASSSCPRVHGLRWGTPLSRGSRAVYGELFFMENSDYFALSVSGGAGAVTR